MNRSIHAAILSRPSSDGSSQNAERETAERCHSIVYNSPYGICRVRLGGQFEAANPALCEMTGYSEAELLASNLDILNPEPGLRARLLAEYESRPTGMPVEMPWRRRDGRIVTARGWAYAERDDSGAIVHFDCYIEDVTPLRAAENALRQAEKLAVLGQLVSSVAHELNNPLSSILMFTEDLLATGRSTDDQEALGIIAQQARRSREIVRDLLSFVRSHEVNGEVSREPVKSRLFLTQLTRALQPQLAELGVSLRLSTPDDESVIQFNLAGIEQVVTNLIVNGAQAAGAGGTVWVNVQPDPLDLVIHVVDDGPGIPADVLPRIFEPFFTTKSTGNGTGLGLSVSLGLVQQHAGTIIADNRDALEGSGARFTVRIPTAHARRTDIEGCEVAPATAAETVRRVLIVDDEEPMRSALGRFYVRRGWSVSEAKDGLAAYRYLIDAGETFDLIVSDMNMPDLSGIELHAHLRQSRPELLDRLLLCTGEAESARIATFVAETNCRVLRKPFELRVLATLSDEIAAVAPRARLAS